MVSRHTTSTALHQLKNQITQGFNKPQPLDHTIVVSLDPSKAFDTVNIHSLIHKLHQTNIPPTIIKYIANYIKGRKGYILHLNARSRPQQFKTGVPQEGVLSPTLLNIYTKEYNTHNISRRHEPCRISPQLPKSSRNSTTLPRRNLLLDKRK